MKIPQKRIVRKLLGEKFTEAFRAFRRLAEVMPKNERRYVKTLIDRTFSIIESVKLPRSHKQSALYFMAMKYMQVNIPDSFCEAYRKAYKSDRKVFTVQWWHWKFLGQFDKESFDFFHQDGYEATIYVNNVFDYICEEILHIDAPTAEDRRHIFTEAVKVFYDETSHEKILLYD